MQCLFNLMKKLNLYYNIAQVNSHTNWKVQCCVPIDRISTTLGCNSSLALSPIMERRLNIVITSHTFTYWRHDKEGSVQGNADLPPLSHRLAFLVRFEWNTRKILK